MSDIKLYNGDCLEIMDELIKQGIKVDAIITDPPYGTTACSWDSIIPFDEMWKRLNKLIKPHGAIVLFGSEPFSSALRMSNIKNYRESLIWLKNKAGSGLQAKQKHIKITEDIIVFSKHGKCTYNPQKWLVEKKEFLTQRKTLKDVEVGNNIYSKMTKRQTKDDGSRYPLNVISCRVPFTPSKTKTYSNNIDIRFHPTQKPVELMKYLIKTYTNENDTVLDFTMGVGTTGMACRHLGRNFIGIELDKKYYEIAKKRIYGEMQLNLFEKGV